MNTPTEAKPCARHRWHMETCRDCNPYEGMTVAKLIAALSELPADAPIDAWCDAGVCSGEIASVYLTDDGYAVLEIE